MSAVQTSLGRVTVKRCSNRFAATGKVCRESVVVTRKRRFCCTHRKPSSRRTRFGRAETRPEAVRREFLLQTHRAVSLARSLSARPVPRLSVAHALVFASMVAE